MLWITTQFQIGVENLLAYIFILTIGILHGSNDIELLQRRRGADRKFNAVLSLYVLIVICSVILFLLFPKLALIVFLLFSAYHFGEQHLTSKVKRHSLLSTFLYCVYGFVVFLLIFYSNANETSLIIYDMTGVETNKEQFFVGLLVSLGLLILTVIVLFRKSQIGILFWEELLYLGLFYIIFLNATLLWSFAIYFIIWHAIPSLKDQILLLYGSVSKFNLAKYLRTSILYWVLSVIGIYGLYEFTGSNERLFNQLFFSFIAAVTFPHVLVMGEMFKNESD